MGKTGWFRRISRPENRGTAKGYSFMGKDKDDKISMSGKDETISKLREANQTLSAERESLKEEREAAKKIEENWKETERDLRKVISALQQQVNDEVERHSNSVHRYQLTENCLNEQNEMLQKEVDNARYLLEMQNQKFLVENATLKKQLEEKEEQTTEFKSFQAEFAKKYTEMEEKHFELLKENEEREKIILSLQRENVSLGNDKILLLQSLNEESKRFQEISVKCLKSDERVLYLESESMRLQAELVSAKSAYDEVCIQLNKIEEEMDKLSNDSRQMHKEKEALNQNLMLQLSIKKELEEQLLSTKSSLEALKESASKGEQQIAMLLSQLLYIADKKDNQIFDIQCELCAMVIQLADLQDQLSCIEEEKRLLEEKNSGIERRKMVFEEEQQHLKGRIGELEKTLDFVNKDLESSKAMVVEKDCQLADLRHRLSDHGDAKRCLHEENNSLRTELKKYAIAFDKIRELESAIESVNKDLEFKDIQLQQLRAEIQRLKAHMHENRKSESVHNNGIIDSGHEKENQNGWRENGKPNGIHANGKPGNAHEKQPQKQLRGKGKSKR